jgi:hypothetical protein
LDEALNILLVYIVIVLLNTSSNCSRYLSFQVNAEDQDGLAAERHRRKYDVVALSRQFRWRLPDFRIPMTKREVGIRD